MQIDFSLKAAVPKQVLVRLFEKEAVLLNLDTEQYHGLDEVGTRMWEALIQAADIQTAYDRLLGEYEVSPESLRQDLVDFLEQLLNRGLVHLVPQ